MSEIAEPTDLVADLEATHTAYEEATERVVENGEHELRTVTEAHDRATTLLDKYEERATGTGDFEGFIEFQETFARFVESLDDDLPHREAFENANENFEKRRLSSTDFTAARNALAPVEELAELLDERNAKREKYRKTRRRVAVRREEVNDRIEELERLSALSDLDFDASIGNLREPIETYNERVAAAFGTFRREASVRELLQFVTKTRYYPLASFRLPPADLLEYVERSAVGTEPLTQLLDYANYSPSKLTHYVESPDELKRNVSVHRSYLDGLDAKPLEIEWPPPPAAELRFRVRELVSVVGRFAPDETITKLHEIRTFTRKERYEHLRRVAEVRAELTTEEQKRLAEGGVEIDLERAREKRDRLDEALSAHPAP